MSFGFSIGDGVLLAQLAWRTVQGARRALGEYDELTCELSGLHNILQRLQRELANPDSLLNRAEDDRKQELNELGGGCERILRVMESVITKYNALSEGKRSGKQLWQKIRFGNGEVQDLADIRMKLSTHTTAIMMNINLCSLGSQGRVERQLNGLDGDLKGMKEKIEWVAANITTNSREGTVWTSHSGDDKTFWRDLRRGLVKEGYRSSVISKHKDLITGYVVELGDRGVFDQTGGKLPRKEMSSGTSTTSFNSKLNQSSRLTTQMLPQTFSTQKKPLAFPATSQLHHNSHEIDPSQDGSKMEPQSARTQKVCIQHIAHDIQNNDNEDQNEIETEGSLQAVSGLDEKSSEIEVGKAIEPEAFEVTNSIERMIYNNPTTTSPNTLTGETVLTDLHSKVERRNDEREDWCGITSKKEDQLILEETRDGIEETELSLENKSCKAIEISNKGLPKHTHELLDTSEEHLPVVNGENSQITTLQSNHVAVTKYLVQDFPEDIPIALLPYSGLDLKGAIITLKDAVGRRYSIPFETAAYWQVNNTLKSLNCR